MTLPSCAHEALAVEHRALVRYCGQVQSRCSDLLERQAAELMELTGQVMRLRAEVIVRETALAWAREDQEALEQELSVVPMRIFFTDPRKTSAHGSVRQGDVEPPADDLVALEASLVAADLVICQTGCLSHNAYWRVRDHCRRTGKPCVVMSEPEAFRIVRLHGA